MFPEQTSSPPKNWSIKIFNQHKTMKQNSLNIFRDNFNKTFKQSVDAVKSLDTALAKREAVLWRNQGWVEKVLKTLGYVLITQRSPETKMCKISTFYRFHRSLLNDTQSFNPSITNSWEQLIYLLGLLNECHILHDKSAPVFMDVK